MDRQVAGTSNRPRGRNSPFTAALLKHIATPNVEIGTIMRRVRADVVTATHERQVPWDHSSLDRGGHPGEVTPHSALDLVSALEHGPNAAILVQEKHTARLFVSSPEIQLRALLNKARATT